MKPIVKIFSVVEFMTALNIQSPSILEIQNSLLFPYPVILPKGFSLRGTDPKKCILSFNVSDGIGLTADNEISDLIIQAQPSSRAIFILSDRVDLGTFQLSHLTVTGQIQILTRAGTQKAKVIADHIDVVACDARSYCEQPEKYGVKVYQGAFTVYNFNRDKESCIEATLTNISIGREGAPVMGSGLFICGYGDEGGRVTADLITTSAIYSNGMISHGTPNLITGAVFIVYGVHVKKIIHQAAVVTYGVNDMVLDTWGVVDHWVAEKPLISYGPSGIGFVNFGVVDLFEAKDKIETFGLGARGFNQYDGTIGRAVFTSITTHGNGSLGIQVSKPVGTIEVKGEVVTYGSLGETLVKGVIMKLGANAVSVRPQGEIQTLILGGITTHGDEVIGLEVTGKVGSVSVIKAIVAEGVNATGLSVREGAQLPLKSALSVISEQGIAVAIEKGSEILNQDKMSATGAKGNVVRG